MDRPVSDELFASVKRKLAITWNDERTDLFLKTDIIPNSMVSLIERLGLEPDYSFDDPGREKNLLLALCFYTYNDAEDEFWENYQKELMAVREKWRAEEYAHTSQASADIP